MTFQPTAFTPAPFGVGVFTDLNRGKSFVTLHFRHDRLRSEADVLAFATGVLDALPAAGLRVAGPIQEDFTRTGRKWRCYLRVPVQAAPENEAALLTWAGNVWNTGRES